MKYWKHNYFFVSDEEESLPEKEMIQESRMS